MIASYDNTCDTTTTIETCCTCCSSNVPGLADLERRFRQERNLERALWEDDFADWRAAIEAERRRHVGCRPHRLRTQHEQPTPRCRSPPQRPIGRPRIGKPASGYRSHARVTNTMAPAFSRGPVVHGERRYAAQALRTYR